jgi:hypothetical protein
VITTAAPDRRPPISRDFLIIGEGQGDAAFVKYLCAARELGADHFQIEEAGGSGKFEAYIGGLRFRPNFDRVKGLLVIGDNDDAPDDNFGNIQNHLKKGKLPRPHQRLALARHGTDGLAVAVMMLPYTLAGGPTGGSLESLLLTSIEDKHPDVADCIDTYRACIPAGGRTKNKEDKFRLRCFLAALCSDDPNISLQYAVSPSKGLVDLKHKCFDEIAKFLNEFPGQCDALPRR